MKENKAVLEKAQYFRLSDKQVTDELDHLGLHIAQMYVSHFRGIAITHWIARIHKLALHISHSKVAGADNYVMTGFKDFTKQKPEEEQNFYQGHNKQELFDKVEELIAEQQKETK